MKSIATVAALKAMTDQNAIGSSRRLIRSPWLGYQPTRHAHMTSADTTVPAKPKAIRGTITRVAPAET